MTNTPRALVALCLVTIGLVAAGCGSTSGAGGSDPASVVPESSFVYGEATIDPSGSQESAMRSILADLPGTGAPQARIENLLRDALKSDKTNKLDWDKDIKPWLGDKVGGFVAGNVASFASGSVPAAAIIATTDGDAARAALEKDKATDAAHRRYRDVEYIVETDNGNLSAEGVVDGYLIAGSDAGMKAVIDASKDGRTLDKVDKFKQATKDVPDERVGFAYIDLGGVVQLATQAAGSQIPGGALLGRLLANKAFVVTARAENQALVFESQPLGGRSAKSTGDGRALMEQMPAGSWAALALPGAGEAFSRGFVSGFQATPAGSALLKQLKTATGLDLQRDVLSWIGDIALFVDGDSKDSLGGGALIKSKNPAASKRALTKIAALIARTDPSTRVASARIPGAFGYQLRSSTMPRSVFMVQKNGQVALTYGEAEARAALGTGGLATSADFKRAADGLGGDYTPVLYASVPPILRLADAFGASSDKDYVKAKPYLTILDYLIAGGAHHDNGATGRLRIGFKPHE